MDEMKQMLKAVINGQHALREEFNTKFAESDKNTEALRSEMKAGFVEVNKRFDEVDKRLDKQGKTIN